MNTILVLYSSFIEAFISQNKKFIPCKLNSSPVQRTLALIGLLCNPLISVCMYIDRVRHMKCYRAIALKLLNISKNVSDKSFSVREGRHNGPPYFLSVEALRLRQGQLHFFKWKHVFFFDDIIADFKTNSVTYNTR